MAHRSTIGLEGVVVGSITGRGHLSACVSDVCGSRVRLRLDDSIRSDFWCELTLDLESLRLAVERSHEDAVEVV